MCVRDGADRRQSFADVLDELAGRTRRGPAPRVEFGGPGSAALPRDPVVWFRHLGIAIARALAAVHARGLVHRDVKPSSILLRADGTPLLSDFGVVRDEHAELTRSGQIVGTPLFAPPEQLAGRHEAVGCAPTCSRSAPPCTSRSPALPRLPEPTPPNWRPASRRARDDR